MDTGGATGQIIAGRYRLSRQLGRGGMGSVWRAEDLTLGSPVAVKLIDASLAADDSVRARFYQEAKAAAALRSPHVVQILDHGVDGGIPFIAMELLEGESLADRLERVRIPPYGETARLFGDVARAVRKAHDAGIVHRDLKPDNIFLVRNDDEEVAKVLDFGIAKGGPSVGGQTRATGTGVLIGTPPYMSPEQARGAKIDPRTDLWALGVIVFECVCGRRPFTADAPGELVLEICAHPIPVPSEVAQVPSGFDAWFARATARNPDERFQSAREMADTLRPILAGTAPESVVATPRQTAPRAEPNGAPAHPAPEPIGGLGAVPGAAERPGTMNGAAFARAAVTPSRAGTGARLGAMFSGLALAVVVVVTWLVKGRIGEGPAPSSPGAPIVEQAAPLPAPPGPIVSPAGTALRPSAAPAPSPAVKPVSTSSGTGAARRVEPVPPAPTAAPTPAPKAASAPSVRTPDQKPEDRVGF